MTWLIGMKKIFHQPISTYAPALAFKNERTLEIGQAFQFALRQTAEKKEDRMTMRRNRVSEESTNQERA